VKIKFDGREFEVAGDEIEIDGIRYALCVFDHLANGRVREWFRIIDRPYGTVTIECFRGSPPPTDTQGSAG